LSGLQVLGAAIGSAVVTGTAVIANEIKKKRINLISILSLFSKRQTAYNKCYVPFAVDLINDLNKSYVVIKLFLIF
jgi:hypothetical protein